MSIFRLALSATGEFTDFHGGDISKVLSVMLKMVNLVNAVFERDLGVRFVLIDRSDDLIFQFSNADPFTKGNESSENQQLLDRIIGDVNYDIGHVLGGLQTVSIGKIGSVCQKGEKGRGVSTALVPDGIYFTFDYFFLNKLTNKKHGLFINELLIFHLKGARVFIFYLIKLY